MSKDIVALDLDDVVLNYVTALLLWHNRTYGTDFTPEDIYQYDLAKTWNCTTEESFCRVQNFHHSEEHDAIQVNAGCISVLEEFQDRVEFVVITSRPGSLYKKTLNTIAERIPHLLKRVHFSTHVIHAEGLEHKGEICRRVGARIIFDDAPMHIEKSSPFVEKAFLFNQPWNVNYKKLPPNGERVFGWEGVRGQLIDLYA